jgi:NDP-sugar pyrophosphorylase family protein
MRSNYPTAHRDSKKKKYGASIMMQVLIPMSGQGTRYKKVGYEQPKPLIPVSGRPIIERLLEKIPSSWPVTFVLAENHRESELPSFLSKLRPKAQQIFIPPHTKGPTFALKSAIPFLPSQEPVLVSYCDYGLKWDPWDFAEFVKNSRCHSALLSYRGFHAHYLSSITYAFSRLEGERVVEVREKGSFTDQRENEFASAGAYYFDTVNTLSEAIEAQERLNLSLNGEFYTSLTIEALLRSRPDTEVRVYEIPAFYQWGTPEELQIFEYWENTFKHWSANQNHKMSVTHVHMPMAGLGSRFKNHYDTPKPFLFIDDTPMYRWALNSLPKGTSTSFISLKSAQTLLHWSSADEKAKFLAETPPGQAFSVQEGLALIPNHGDLLISACDHSIV